MNIFYSYAHTDERLRRKLEAHLSTLKQQNLIADWHDRNISAGEEWVSSIHTHLNTADIILLLISPDFIASSYCYSIEMTRALERHQAKEACIIPILLRPVDWVNAPFSHLQALPKNGKPVTTWRKSDEAFLDIAIGIRNVVEALHMADLMDSPSLRGTAQSYLTDLPLAFPTRDVLSFNDHRSQPTKHLLHLERQRQKYISPPHKPSKIGKDVIIDYDLETQMAMFRQSVHYGGAAIFVLGGYRNILGDYIIERMCRELQSKLHHNHHKIDISLHINDIIEDIHHIIQQKMIVRCHCNTLVDIFKNTPYLDIVLVIWNYTFPLEEIRVALTSFWEAVTTQVAPFLEEHGQCFTIIVANADTRATTYLAEYFTCLPTPTQFDTSDLIRWFKGWLKSLSVDQAEVEYCLNRLSDQHGHFIATYHEMEDIISYLQGRYTVYE